LRRAVSAGKEPFPWNAALGLNEHQHGDAVTPTKSMAAQRRRKA
jgi:hypothetical protein